MLHILSDKQIAVFDNDGVFVENPPEACIKGVGPINDFDFWERHWREHDKAKLNHEMVELADTLLAEDWQVIVLTARPERFREHTYNLLQRAGLPVAKAKVELFTSACRFVPIVMFPEGYVNRSLSSAQFKHNMIQHWLSQHARIKFMVEDYKPNADKVRELVPVLLYERKKLSGQ